MKVFSKTGTAVIAAVAALACVPLTASAASMSSGGHDWSGFYLGAHAGLGFSEFDHDATRVSPTGNTISAMLGGQLGYNYQVNRNVFGLEVDASDLSLNNDFVNFTTSHFSEDWQSTIRARYGYAMGAWLPYVTAGVALTGATAKIDNVGSQTATTAGYALGGGVDVGLGGNWSGRAEFLVTQVPRTNITVGATPMSIASTNETFRIGVNYSLGNLLK